MPKATYYRRQDEVDLYHAYFNTQVQRWAEPIGEVVERALEIPEASGLSALDALHVAAALFTGATELVRPKGQANPSTG